ncbi:MAG: glycosyltransferase family 4 protein [Candidatus Bathyarchaeota archaeon]|nr:glycosyltransferase family 4 protein [Candidatus Bathyarchaeota archaeon]
MASPYLKKGSKEENLELIPVSKNPLAILLRLKIIIVKERIDLILERMEGESLLYDGFGPFFGNVFKIPSAVEIHVPPYDVKTRLTSFLWLRYSLKHCSKIFLISKNVADYLWLHNRFLQGKVILMPNGFDPSKSHADVDEVEKLKNNLPRGRPIICYFGELSADKGIDIIIELIKNDVGPFYYLIAGWGPYAQMISDLAKERSNRVKYLGEVSKEKIYAYLRICDLSLAPYRKTQLGGKFFGQPLKVYESLAAGTNILVTSQMNLPNEVFELCTLTEPSVDGIQAKLRQACLKKSDAKWLSSLDEVMPKYSWDNIVKRFFVPEFKQMAELNKKPDA